MAIGGTIGGGGGHGGAIGLTRLSTTCHIAFWIREGYTTKSKYVGDGGQYLW